mmetsp:Transcript_21889/g.60958  ORF Transcript_21889/g.60958 Transcript_21889/m.60958 type:complete len:246 (+) Transcript_21889:333-1070(+)
MGGRAGAGVASLGSFLHAVVATSAHATSELGDQDDECQHPEAEPEGAEDEGSCELGLLGVTEGLLVVDDLTDLGGGHGVTFVVLGGVVGLELLDLVLHALDGVEEGNVACLQDGDLIVEAVDGRHETLLLNVGERSALLGDDEFFLSGNLLGVIFSLESEGWNGLGICDIVEDQCIDCSDGLVAGGSSDSDKTELVLALLDVLLVVKSGEECLEQSTRAGIQEGNVLTDVDVAHGHNRPGILSAL